MNQLYKFPGGHFALLNKEFNMRSLVFKSLGKVTPSTLSMMEDDTNFIDRALEDGELVAEIPTYLEYIQEHNPEVLL